MARPACSSGSTEVKGTGGAPCPWAAAFLAAARTALGRLGLRCVSVLGHAAPVSRRPPCGFGMLYSCRMSCTSFSEHCVSATVELKEMPPPFLGCRGEAGAAHGGAAAVVPIPPGPGLPVMGPHLEVDAGPVFVEADPHGLQFLLQQGPGRAAANLHQCPGAGWAASVLHQKSLPTRRETSALSPPRGTQQAKAAGRQREARCAPRPAGQGMNKASVAWGQAPRGSGQQLTPLGLGRWGQSRDGLC